MVDSIGSRPTRDAPAPVVPAARASRASSQPSPTVKAQLELSALAFEYEKSAADRSAKIDEQRVAEVRRAVHNGTYPITPETIADRLLALKLNWSPKQ